MRTLFVALTLFFVSFALPAMAGQSVWEEMLTNIKVTVKAQDAKFIGTSMGGAHVTVTSRMTGDILAEGVTSGGTGNGGLIMADPLARDAVIVDDSAASFQFGLALLEPTPVTVSVKGPLAQPQGMVMASHDFLLIPGKDYTTDNGIMIELPGMVVDVLNPPVHSSIPADPDKPVQLAVNVRKLCGCTIDSGTPWPPERYQVEAHIYKDSQQLQTLPMNPAGDSMYGLKLKLAQPGTYRVVVTAYDLKTKEGGMDATTFIIQ